MVKSKFGSSEKYQRQTATKVHLDTRNYFPFVEPTGLLTHSGKPGTKTTNLPSTLHPKFTIESMREGLARSQ